MVEKFLSVDPHKIDDDVWWYEENIGITVVVRFRDNQGICIGSEQRVISWRSLRAALRRKNKESAAKAKRKK